MSGGDEKALRYFRRYSEPENVGKALLAFRQKMDAGELVAPMPKDADPETKKAWREANGVPEEASGYYDALKAKEIEIGDDDKPLFEGYFNQMHEAGASPDQVMLGVNSFFEARQRQEDAIAEADGIFKQQTEDQLRSDWGNEYRANLNHMGNVLSPLMPEGLWDSLQEARMPDGRKFADHPDMMKFLVNASRQIADIGTVTGETTHQQKESVDTRIAELKVLMGDKTSIYWRGPMADKLQDEYRSLIVAQDRLAAR